MSKSTTKRNKELLSLQTNAGRSHNSNFGNGGDGPQVAIGADQEREDKGEQLIVREPVEHTPFHVIGNEEKGYFLAIGMHRLTEPKESQHEAIECLDKDFWNILTNVVIAMQRLVLEAEKKEG